MVVSQMARSKQSMNEVHSPHEFISQGKKMTHEVNRTHEQIFLFLFTI